MKYRPTGKPYDVIGPVTIYVRRNSESDQPTSACAWVGNYCVGEYSCGDVVVEHPSDPKRNVVVEEPDGDIAVECLINGVYRWLGYHRALRRSHARRIPR